MAARSASFAAIAAIAAAWMSGCASAPSLVRTGDPSAAFTPGATYRIASPDDAGDSPLESRLGAHLATRGLRVAEGGTPNLLVEVSASARPIDTGAYTTLTPPPRPAPEGAWLAAPGQRRWWTPRRAGFCVMDVRASDPTTGRELYRVRAEERRRRGDCPTVQDRLLDLALASPSAPTAPMSRHGR
ncbi:MAG: hypothetical protein DI570_09730 [Phenylobacterium zucineum]|nr:MAG: hypothetical protein DI570_09730 [Phenylobacterium zucineum]